MGLIGENGPSGSRLRGSYCPVVASYARQDVRRSPGLEAISLHGVGRGDGSQLLSQVLGKVRFAGCQAVDLKHVVGNKAEIQPLRHAKLVGMLQLFPQGENFPAVVAEKHGPLYLAGDSAKPAMAADAYYCLRRPQRRFVPKELELRGKQLRVLLGQANVLVESFYKGSNDSLRV